MDKQANRYFIGIDCSGHEYLIPLSKKKEWEEYTNIPEDDERSWNIPDYAESIDGGTLTFENPRNKECIFGINLFVGNVVKELIFMLILLPEQKCI